jgi:hypothetical protein
MTKCTNKNCSKNSKCLHYIGRLTAIRIWKVKNVFTNNESTCKEFVEV